MLDARCSPHPPGTVMQVVRQVGPHHLPVTREYQSGRSTRSPRSMPVRRIGRVERMGIGPEGLSGFGSPLLDLLSAEPGCPFVVPWCAGRHSATLPDPGPSAAPIGSLRRMR